MILIPCHCLSGIHWDAQLWLNVRYAFFSLVTETFLYLECVENFT